MKKRNLKFVSGRSTPERILNVLSGEGGEETTCIVEPADNDDPQSTPVASTIRAEAAKAILEKSFMAHQKGKKREACSLGHKLEKPILKNWIRLIHSDFSPAPGIHVHGAYTAGLAAKKSAVYAKDSIDFIVMVNDDQDYSESPVKAWGFECKGRVTANTAAAEERALAINSDPHTRMDADEVFNKVKDVSERFQVLQHSYVYDLDTVVLAVADSQADLICSRIIDFPITLRMDFDEVLEDIKDLCLDWAYPSRNTRQEEHPVLEIPEDIKSVAAAIKTINGEETLQGTANVWLALCNCPKPFPSFFRLIPAVCAYWNAVKGGSDTTTRLMDCNNVKLPRAWTNAETAAVTRLILLNFVTIHRLFQICTATDVERTYGSLENYRNAANQRFTFHKSILHINGALKNELRKFELPQQHQPSTPKRQPLRQLPNRQKFHGMNAEIMTCMPALSTKTPKKMTAKVNNGTASDEVCNMIHNCTGMPIKVVSVKDARGRCSVCQAEGRKNQRTSWKCMGCKRWLCMERPINLEKNKADPSFELCKENKTEGNHFMKLCFHRAHEDAWHRLFSSDQTEN